MHRFGGTAGGVSTRFRGVEGGIRKSGALGAWLCCALLIGFGLSPAAIAQETVTYIHTDALGSVVAESDANGNVIKRYDYEPYGAVVGGTFDERPRPSITRNPGIGGGRDRSIISSRSCGASAGSGQSIVFPCSIQFGSGR